jgi:putative transposase
MIKARHHILQPTPEQCDLLKQIQQEAAGCWNAIVAEAKAHYDAGGGWISKNDLQKRLKGRFDLHSQTVQGLVDRFCGNRRTAAENRRMGLDTNYPWREKRFVTVPFKQMAIRCSASGTIQLSLRAGVYFDTGVPFSDGIHTCEIIWRHGRYVLSCTAEYQPAEPAEQGLRAGIDIGEIHPVAVCAENGAGLVVSGRQIRSAKQQRNKSLGAFAKRLSRCKKGSRRWKKLQRAKARLRAKTDRQVRDLLHQATRKTIDWCREQGVSELVIGNPAGVEKNTRKGKRLNRKARQKVSQMETGRIKQYLRYKAEEAGIRTCLVDERGTSRDCPVCGSQNRVRGRLFVCAACGFSAHRDGKAGFMMLWKKHPQIPLPQLRIEHRQAYPKYRKRLLPACVDGPDVAPSSLAIPGPLLGEHIAA